MSKQEPNQYPHSIGLAPQQAQGVRAVPVVISFPGLVNTIQTYSDDFNLEEIDGTISGIQSVYFDNSRNFLPMFLVINETQQSVTFPPGSQGYLPIFAIGGMSYTVSMMGTESGQQGNSILRMLFSNTPIQPFIWFPYENSNGYAQSVFAAAGAALTVQTNNGTANYPNRRIYIDGFDTEGDNPTAAAVITAALTNTVATAGGQIATVNYRFSTVSNTVAVGGGYFFEKKFNPPLLVGAGSAITGGGFQTALGVLTVSAAGAGQAGATANLYWHMG